MPEVVGGASALPQPVHQISVLVSGRIPSGPQNHRTQKPPLRPVLPC